MFNLIKSWFKRPVVINFNVEAISGDAKVCVLTTTHNLTQEVVEQLEDRLNGWRGESRVIVIGNSKPLQVLSDDDLKAIGLIRADFGDKYE